MNTASDPKGRGITVTIKYGSGYDQPWIVFHGLTDEVRRDIIGCFGLDVDEAAQLSLADVIVNVSGQARALGAVAGGLGATVIESGPARAVREPVAPPASDRDQPSRDKPEADAHPLIGVIAQTPDVRSLERLWVENQEAFGDPAVMAAWKERGRVLSRA